MEEGNKRRVNVKNIIKILLIILYQILVVMALILTMVIVLQRVSASNQSIGGYRIFRVVTGSMEPEYEVGEVVICKETDAKDIKIGDDIVYLGRNGEYAGKIIMHNVIGIDKDENGKLTFHARGLHSSSVEDPQIAEEQIYGVVKYTSKILTIMYDLATNIYSIFIIIIILALNVFIAFNTPKKTKKRKVKQIANPNDEMNIEDYEEEQNYEEFEEDYEEEQNYEEFEEDYEEDYEDNEEEFEEEYDYNEEQKIDENEEIIENK